ncbi:divalent cation tolerance protein CutA [Synechococcus sp. PCC 7335]|uniref:divalent cation tolerance protein CutA n=1 Tax=Synechococcus sp. (strain ATCC 29403 / PCC 7335) TaxID=91464 RepID=UPI0009FED611
MSSQYSVVITTVSSDNAATNLAEALLSKQLAACVQVLPFPGNLTSTDIRLAQIAISAAS